MTRILPSRPLAFELVERLDIRSPQNNKYGFMSLTVNAGCPVYLWQRNMGSPHLYIYKNRHIPSSIVDWSLNKNMSLLTVSSEGEEAKDDTSEHEPFIVICTPIKLNAVHLNLADYGYAQVQATVFSTKIHTGNHSLIEISECEIGHAILAAGSDSSVSFRHDGNCIRVTSGAKSNIVSTGNIGRLTATMGNKATLTTDLSDEVLLHAQPNARVKAWVNACNNLNVTGHKQSRTSVCLGSNSNNVSMCAMNNSIINCYGNAAGTVKAEEKYTISKAARTANEIGFSGQARMIEDNIGINLTAPKSSCFCYTPVPQP